MEKTMHKKNACDQKTEIVIMEGPVEEVVIEEITSVMKNMQLGKASGLSRGEHGNGKCKWEI